MLGNFSIGDYFKQRRREFAWELSTEGFGLEPERIWITVFEGDEELGLGPDEEAIDAWLAIGVPRDRIVAAARAGELLAGGPDRPLRPVHRALPRPRARVRQPDDLPGGDYDRFLEYWNLVFMQYDQTRRHAHAAAGQEHRHRPRPRAPRRRCCRARTRCSRPTQFGR